jgi:hypothetical protein
MATIEVEPQILDADRRPRRRCRSRLLNRAPERTSDALRSTASDDEAAARPPADEVQARRDDAVGVDLWWRYVVEVTGLAERGDPRWRAGTRLIPARKGSVGGCPSRTVGSGAARSAGNTASRIQLSPVAAAEPGLGRGDSNPGLARRPRPASASGSSAPIAMVSVGAAVLRLDPVGAGHDVGAAALAGRRIGGHGGECLVDRSGGQPQVGRARVGPRSLEIISIKALFRSPLRNPDGSVPHRQAAPPHPSVDLRRLGTALALLGQAQPPDGNQPTSSRSGAWSSGLSEHRPSARGSARCRRPDAHSATRRRPRRHTCARKVRSSRASTARPAAARSATGTVTTGCLAASACPRVTPSSGTDRGLQQHRRGLRGMLGCERRPSSGTEEDRNITGPVADPSPGHGGDPE